MPNAQTFAATVQTSVRYVHVYAQEIRSMQMRFANYALRLVVPVLLNVLHMQATANIAPSVLRHAKRVRLPAQPNCYWIRG